MYENETFVDDTVDHIPEDDDSTLRQNAPIAHGIPQTAADFCWIFVGTRSMPHAEHLIPFRT